MLTDKKPFDMMQQAKAPSEVRQAQALEFIAHYLERIDGHLERLASAVENGAGLEKIRADMKSLEGFLRNKA